MRKILSNNYFFVTIYLFLAFLAFGLLPLAFFQQDEWAIIGTYLYFDKVNLGWFERLFTYGHNTHIIPLSGMLSILEYKLFGLDFSSYAYFSIGIHLLNAGLVFYLTYLFFKKNPIAFIAGLIFLVDFIPSQGVTWIATTSSTVSSATFTLLALIFLTKTLFYKSNKKFIVLFFVFLFMALLFKESAIFMFLFVPFFWFIFDSKRNYKRISRFLIGIFVLGLAYVIPRIFLMIFNSASTTAMSDVLSTPTLPVYIYRVITMPLKAIAQSIIPVDQIVAIAEEMVKLGYPNLAQIGISNSFVAQNMGADIVSYGVTVMIIMLCIFLYKKALKNNMRIHANILIISLAFIALSSLPLIFVLGNPGYFSLFDGRYLYMSSIFKSILLADIAILTYTFLGKKKIIAILLTLFFLFFIVFNVKRIRYDAHNEIIRGDDRKSILNQIARAYPKLPEKVVFYTQSNAAHYGLPVEEKIMPFYSGFGQTLLVWYEGHGQNFPACFFQDKYLYAIIEQGYKECEGKGYGYFRKLDSLKEAILKHNIDPENVISFKYTSGEDRLEDISIEIRKELSL